MTFEECEKEVKLRIAAVLWLEGVPCQPEELNISVEVMSESDFGVRHSKVTAILPNGEEYPFDHWPNYGFPELDDAALPPEVEEWLNEQARAQAQQLEADPTT